MSDFFYQRDATFNPDRTHRFLLGRSWAKKETEERNCLSMFMLNPSIADERQDDLTTQFCVKMARRNGFNSYFAINLFPVVGTNPNCLLEDGVELFNDRSLCDQVIRSIVHEASDMIVVAWGSVNPKLQWRVDDCISIMKERRKTIEKLHCFGQNKDGAPRFPRALSKDIVPVRMEL